MFKDIVVNLSVRKGSKAVGDYAVSVAETLEAHLTGVAVAFVPSIPGASLGYLPIETIEAQQRENEMAAEDAVDHFTAASAKAGVAAERRVLRTGFPAAAEQFSRIARRFDLAIVGQLEPDVNSVEAAIAESTLFDSGRPIVIVPYIQKAPLTLERVMVCWDGSRAAARAIADAMPLLERAGSVQVVIVASERGKYDQIEGADMGLHLARHGVKVEVTRIARGKIDVADALLSHAADCSADFMVMGGYGHSRLREFVLGGVTRSML
ncbi:MAG TPA: universal stress protein, partial [Xanthobacteraceae bacterium]|nr:universal stress protein [Xanthobacteraceae bacterium]